ncbi:hypothetical protein [Streptomyces sp. IBSBF 2806]
MTATWRRHHRQVAAGLLLAYLPCQSRQGLQRRRKPLVPQA